MRPIALSGGRVKLDTHTPSTSSFARPERERSSASERPRNQWALRME